MDNEGEPPDSSPTSVDSRAGTAGPGNGGPGSSSSSSTLAEAFGYYGPSEFNTMALVRKVGPVSCAVLHNDAGDPTAR